MSNHFNSHRYLLVSPQQVAIRSRPLNARELEKSDFEVVRILDERVVVLIDPGYEMNQNDILRKNRNKEMQFAFDFAFD